MDKSPLKVNLAFEDHQLAVMNMLYQVHCMIMADRHLTVREIANDLVVSAHNFNGRFVNTQGGCKIHTETVFKRAETTSS